MFGELKNKKGRKIFLIWKKNSSHASVALLSSSSSTLRANCSIVQSVKAMFSKAVSDVVSFSTAQLSFDVENVEEATLILDLLAPAKEAGTVSVNSQLFDVQVGATQLLIPVRQNSSFFVSGSVDLESGMRCGTSSFAGTFQCEPKLLVRSFRGDFNMDLLVNKQDLSLLFAVWGNCSDCVEDLDRNGSVDLNDVAGTLDLWKE